MFAGLLAPEIARALELNPAQQLLVTSATADTTAETLTLRGRNLVKGSSIPIVTLNDEVLTLLSATAEEIVAVLPPRGAGHVSADPHARPRPGQVRGDRSDARRRRGAGPSR